MAGPLDGIISEGEWNHAVKVLGLSRREAQVVRHLLMASVDSRIGPEISVSVPTVYTHLDQLFHMPAVNPRVELVVCVSGTVRASPGDGAVLGQKSLESVELRKTGICTTQSACEPLPLSPVDHTISAYRSLGDERQQSPEARNRLGGGCMRRPRAAGSILDRIGWKGLCLVVWRSTPFPLRLISFFYALIVYRKLLAASRDPFDLGQLHAARYQSSRSFRLLRPRYHKVRRLLDLLGVQETID